jgi:adenylosuccinate synthase
LQWGDEAKGKLVDLLTAQFDIVVRFLGGANAGHTVVTGGETFKLHHIPSGILNQHVMNIVTAGVVLNPETVLAEIDSLVSRGVRIEDNLVLSDRAHVVMPWHIEEDHILNEADIGGENIGTTLRGIGPCYRDKAGRSLAIRLGDLYQSGFREKVAQIVEVKNKILTSNNGQGSAHFNADEIFTEYSEFAERLKPFVADSTRYLLDALDAGKRLLFEGAQGALLDLDHGTFPFVTSSNSSGVGITAGSGVPPRWINKVIGVIKAYTTRVGGGPFPTEQDNATGKHIRDMGNEYGTTTGRPRRCGWFDGVAARYTSRLSGVDELSVMMLDVLSELPEINICVAYELDGKRIDYFPSQIEDLRRVQPIYETLPGWQQNITEIRAVNDLPQNAQRYLDRISELVGFPVAIVSVGPDREQTMFDPQFVATS